MTENKEATQEAQRRFACFALISNDIRDPREALRLYRNRDVVEKSFANWKNRLNCNRLQVSSELALEGKLFVHFVALILLSYIQKKMHDKGLFKNYSTAKPHYPTARFVTPFAFTDTIHPASLLPQLCFYCINRHAGKCSRHQERPHAQ